MGHAYTIAVLSLECKRLAASLAAESTQAPLHILFYSTDEHVEALKRALTHVWGSERAWSEDCVVLQTPTADVFGMRDLLQENRPDVVVADCVINALFGGWTLPEASRPALIFASALVPWRALDVRQVLGDTWSRSSTMMMEFVELYAGAKLADAYLGPCPFPRLISDESRAAIWREKRCWMTGPWIRPQLRGRFWTGHQRDEVVIYVSGIQSDATSDLYLQSFVRWARRWGGTRLRMFGRCPDAEPSANFDEAICSCRLLISTAGMGVTSEAIYLGVPTVLVPVISTFIGFEQYLNAAVGQTTAPWLLHVPSELAARETEDAKESDGLLSVVSAFVSPPTGSPHLRIHLYDALVESARRKAARRRDAEAKPAMEDGTLEAAEWLLRVAVRMRETSVQNA